MFNSFFTHCKGHKYKNRISTMRWYSVLILSEGLILHQMEKNYWWVWQLHTSRKESKQIEIWFYKKLIQLGYMGRTYTTGLIKWRSNWIQIGNLSMDSQQKFVNFYLNQKWITINNGNRYWNKSKKRLKKTAIKLQKK